MIPVIRHRSRAGRRALFYDCVSRNMFLGIDIGTSFIKAGVLDLDALRVMDVRRIAFPEPLRGCRLSTASTTRPYCRNHAQADRAGAWSGGHRFLRPDAGLVLTERAANRFQTTSPGATSARRVI